MKNERKPTKVRDIRTGSLIPEIVIRADAQNRGIIRIPLKVWR